MTYVYFFSLMFFFLSHDHWIQRSPHCIMIFLDKGHFIYMVRSLCILFIYFYHTTTLTIYILIAWPNLDQRMTYTMLE